jgi:hypothetical protein
MIVGKKIAIFYISGNANYEQQKTKRYDNNTNNFMVIITLINKVTVKIIIQFNSSLIIITIIPCPAQPMPMLSTAQSMPFPA